MDEQTAAVSNCGVTEVALYAAIAVQKMLQKYDQVL